MIITTANPYGTLPIGGAESSSRLLAEELANHGVNVFYSTQRVDSESRRKASAAGVNLRFLQSFRGMRFPLIFRLAEIYWSISLIYLCRHHRIDLIYCSYELSVVNAALLVRSVLGYPKVVMRMAGLYWYIDSKRYPRKAKSYERIFRTVDSINFISHDLVRMTREKIEELKIVVDYRDYAILDIGTSVKLNETRARFKFFESKFNIVMVAGFSEYAKRQDILIQALRHLPKGHQVHLTLVGEGPTRESMKNMAIRLGVADRISFVPFMEQQMLIDFLGEQHLLCHACDFEGLGKIIVESMTIGLPILVSHVPPLNEYVVDGKTGFLVRNVPEFWAERIYELSRSRNLLTQVSGSAMMYARREWSARTNVSCYESYFRRTIAD
jgi:glycosyltransferase involved in cell wall biosynthesis